MFTDGSHIPKEKSITRDDVYGWGLSIHLANPAKGKGFRQRLLDRWGPVRLDIKHAAFVGAVDQDNNVEELNALDCTNSVGS